MFREAGLGPCQFRPRVVDGDAAGHIDEGNPGSDARTTFTRTCNLGRNLHPDSAAFTRTGHLSVPVEGSTDCRPAWGSQSRSGQFDATLFRSRLQFRHARKAQQCRDTGAASLDYLPRPVALRKKPGLRNIGRKVRRRFHWKVATEMLCGLTIARHVWTSRRPVVQT